MSCTAFARLQPGSSLSNLEASTSSAVLQVTGGKSMYRMYHLYYPGTAFGISLWILIFGISQIFISLVRAPPPPSNVCLS